MLLRGGGGKEGREREGKNERRGRGLKRRYRRGKGGGREGKGRKGGCEVRV